jgi:hypothetical protein
MKINLAKLTNVVKKPDGSIVARCPACAENGGDTKGEHLFVSPTGGFNCIAHDGDKAHNRRILKLVGAKPSTTEIRFPINRQVIPPSKVIAVLGQLGRPKSSPDSNEVSINLQNDTLNRDGLEKSCPGCPNS